MNTPGQTSLRLRALLLLALPLACGKGPNDGDDEAGPPSLLPGDVVITEIMADPEGSDGGFEWFEIRNVSSEAIDLEGVELIYSKADGTGQKTHAIARSLTIEPQGYRVVGDVLDEIALTDGDHLDYGYADSLGSFGNTGGYLAIRAGDEIIDEVYYEQTTSGASRAFDGALPSDAAANDDLTRWCDSRTEFEGPTFLATPGADNDLCSQPDCGGNGPATLGSFVITEIHANPDSVDDTLGEWFEIHALADFDLNGLAIGKGGIADEAEEVILSLECISVSAGDSIVFAQSDDESSNGGIPLDAIGWVFMANVSLKNEDGNLWIKGPGGELIDEVTWATAPTGATTQLDPHFEDATANDDLGHWCRASQAYSTELGTPGEINDECAIPAPQGECYDPEDPPHVSRPIAPVPMGGLIITELLANPTGTDGPHEWFELEVQAAGDLNGLLYGRNGAWEPDPIEWSPDFAGELFGACVEVEAGDRIVVARELDPALSCLPEPADGLFDQALGNSANSSLEIGFDPLAPFWDQVIWPTSTEGTSWSFDGVTWCDGVGVYGNQPGCMDAGTPGAQNGACG